jgi:hypothetical protein
LIDWSNLDYFANQLEIANALKEIREDAKIRAEEYICTFTEAETGLNYGTAPIMGRILDYKLLLN